jgi:hypothetical protein
MLAEFGFPPWESFSEAFPAERAMEILAPVFPKVQETIIRNSLVFEAVEPVVNYMRTFFPSLGFPAEPAVYTELTQWLRQQIASAIRRSGPWRDQKHVGVYLARNSSKAS